MMMKRFPARARARRFFSQDSAEGQALVEYSLIFVLIIIVTFSIVTTMSGTIDDKFFQVVQAMP
jgi:Flp pilus assembly pilin Flp